MKKKLITSVAFFALFSFVSAQDDKAPVKKEKISKQSSPKTETVILPDGTSTVVTKSADNKREEARQNQNRRTGKMEAVEVKEIKTQDPK
ncbi:MAG: hypothetical protein N3F09_02410 [Bacteroidia bacterium]|nr:hypothetical protein [Bacteroidia bacterium]